MFKLDMHVHTDETSECGKIKAEKVVNLYYQAGYDGLVITDHYYRRFFVNQGDLNWAEKVENYLAGYYEAQKVGEELGMNIILGIELRFLNNINDYLVYGLTPESLKEYPRLYKLGIKEFSKFAADKDILVYQAHPYRMGMERVSPDFLDGVEVYNAKPRHDSRNHLAYQFAQENNLKMVAGSDFHQLNDLGRSGILLSEEVTNSKELVRLLKREEFELIRPDNS